MQIWIFFFFKCLVFQVRTQTCTTLHQKAGGAHSPCGNDQAQYLSMIAFS